MTEKSMSMKGGPEKWKMILQEKAQLLECIQSKLDGNQSAGSIAQK